MAAPGRRGAVLLRTVLGFGQLGPVGAREWATLFPSLLGCQRRCVSCVAGAAFSGPLLASASGRYGQNSALDRFLGISQPDSSLTPGVPAVSMHRGKRAQIDLSWTVFITESPVSGKLPVSLGIACLALCYKKESKGLERVEQ